VTKIEDFLFLLLCLFEVVDGLDEWAVSVSCYMSVLISFTIHFSVDQVEE